MEITWDHHLVSRASIDLVIDYQVVLPDHHLTETLETAHKYCRNLTSIYSKSFYMASGLFGYEKRKAIRALYAFCRTTDDIIDIQGVHGETALIAWRKHALGFVPRANDPVSIVWAETRKKYKIPTIYARQLIDGVEKDVLVNRYRTFSELADYCYGVASTVGLMSMHIIGYKDESARRYAIKLGVALQLTNILRDISEDYQMGRIYLPQEEMEQFGITENHLKEGKLDENWTSFMKYQIERTRSIYLEARPGIDLLDPSGRLAVAAAAAFYEGILNKIESQNYDVFSGRACLGKWEKIKLLPGLWMKYGWPARLREKYNSK